MKKGFKSNTRMNGSKIDDIIKPSIKGTNYTKPTEPKTFKEAIQTPGVDTNLVPTDKATHHTVQLSVIEEYRSFISNSPMASICINALENDSTKGITYQPVDKNYNPTDAEKEETDKILKRCNLSDYGNFWRNAIHYSLEFAGNVPVEPIFGAVTVSENGITTVPSLLGFRAHNPVEIEKAINTVTGEVDGYVRKYSPYDGAAEIAEWYEKYQLNSFTTFEYLPQIDISKKYMFYIKGFSDYLNLFGTFPLGILNLLSFDFEQINTAKEFTGDGFQGSWVIVATAPDGKETAFYEGQGKPNEDGTYNVEPVDEQIRAAFASGGVHKNFSLTYIPIPEGVTLDFQSMSADVDFSGMQGQSSDVDRKIMGWFRVPASVVFMDTTSGLNSDKSETESEQYNTNTLPQVSGPLFDSVNIVYQRHVTDKLKLSPTYVNPTQELEKAQADKIKVVEIGSKLASEVRQEDDPDAEPIEEDETDINTNDEGKEDDGRQSDEQ